MKIGSDASKTNISQVSIICLCYNHGNFVKKAIASVLSQNYANIQLIVVNDASSDDSHTKILEILPTQHRYIKHEQNQGMCKSFNEALSYATGKYIIDLAADDILLPHKVSTQVNAFENLPENYGVVFSDAYLVLEDGRKQGTFYERDKSGKILKKVPSGDVFKAILQEYIVCSPTIMVKKVLFEELGGYDPNLVYEDYDFFVRSSRNWFYHFIDEPLMIRTIVHSSDSSKFYLPQNQHLVSTLAVQKKAQKLIKSKEESQSLAVWTRYFIRQCFFTHHWQLGQQFGNLLAEIDRVDWLSRCFLMLCKTKIKTNILYRMYVRRRW